METKSSRDPRLLHPAFSSPSGKPSRRTEARREAGQLELLMVLLTFSAMGLGAALARGAWGWAAIDGLLVATCLGLTLTRLRLLFDRMLVRELFSQEARTLARRLFFSPN